MSSYAAHQLTDREELRPCDAAFAAALLAFAETEARSVGDAGGAVLPLVGRVGYVTWLVDQPPIRATGTPQISSAYSRIVRSDENQPMRAVLRMLFRHH